MLGRKLHLFNLCLVHVECFMMFSSAGTFTGIRSLSSPVCLGHEVPQYS